MSWPAALMPLPVLVPLLAAAAVLIFGRRPAIQRIVTLTALSGVAGLCAVLLLGIDRCGTTVVQVGRWETPIGITLVADRLTAMMLLVSTIVLVVVAFYGAGQNIRDRSGKQPVSIFWPTYLILSAGVAMAFVAGDLFNLFVGFEILLLASFVLLTVGATADRIRAAVPYVMVSVLSSSIFLIGIALLYGATGTLNLAHLAVRVAQLPTGTRDVACGVLLVAFGIKAAVFPLSNWLPDSYPTAPAPVTAVFAGLLTKVGVYSIIRTDLLLLPSGDFDTVLLTAGLVTMVVGVFGAIAQNNIRRLLSFTLVSHIGFLMFGIGLSNRAGLTGAIYYVAHHILVQTALFLVAGLIERQAGSVSLRRVGGLAATSPLLAGLFGVGALNLGGVPPFPGFVGKVVLLQAGAQKGGALAWLVVAGTATTSLLTVYVMARVWSKAFWRPRNQAPQGHLAAVATPTLLEDTSETLFDHRTDPGRMPLLMVAATAAVLVAGLGLTVAAGPLLRIADRAAADLENRETYIHAVFPDGPP